MIQNPANFQAAEVGAQRKPGFCSKAILPALTSKIRDVIGSARVLPDDGISNRLAGFAVPHDCGFTLVGDSDGSEIGSGQTARGHRLLHYFSCCAPNFLGIVLHPTRLRIDLPVFYLSSRYDLPSVIEHHKPSAGRTLIEGAYVTGH